MSKTGFITLFVLIAACSAEEQGRFEPTAPLVASLDRSALPKDEACLLDISACPPDGWIFGPAELDPDVTRADSNCDFVMFGVAKTIPQWDLHPTAACLQRHWGNSGIYRQQARDVHVTSLPNLCAGSPGDIDFIRLCSLAWKNRQTPWGFAAGAGCILVKVEATCGV
jgi:hypothetical protein